LGTRLSINISAKCCEDLADQPPFVARQ